MIGQIVFITLALAASIELVPRSSDFFWALSGGFILALALIAGFLFVQRKQPFSYLLAMAGKVPGVDLEEYQDAAAEADQFLLDFYRHHRARLLVSSLCYLFAWSLGPVEIYILLRVLHQPASVEIALLLEAAGLLVERATFIIPAKLVSQEGGKALILALLGYPAGVGFAIGFLRRIKEMVWVLFGLISLMIHRITVGTDTGAGRTDKIVALG
jgi:lysylphosphatidylglycerol synthase-like protein